jgi:aminoglycoside 2''-phosphotransferase
VDKQAVYERRIRDACPGLQIRNASLNSRGQNNDVLVVNGEYIFRFPKYRPALEQLRTETAVLAGIQDYVTLSVPKPVFVDLDTEEIGRAFVGYRRIGGEPLLQATFRAIDDEGVIQALAVQLATFLRQLHGVPVETAVGAALLPYDGHATWADMYARLRQKVFPHMRSEAQAQVAEHFETFLRDPAVFDLVPVLIHGDFGPTNILYDAQSQAVQGIIDFGSAGWGDPVADFASMIGAFGYGQSFVERMHPIYPQVETFWERARFYVGTFALQDALFGIENDDADSFKLGIAPYV